MQSYDENKNLIDTRTGTMDELKEALGNIDGATHHVIGNLPKVGQSMELNGLKFRVRRVKKNGDIELRIFTP